MKKLNCIIDTDRYFYEDEDNYDLAEFEFQEDIYPIKKAIEEKENKRGNNGYIVIADLGLWNGRFIGYKQLGKLDNLFRGEEWNKLEIKDGEIFYEHAHHDGTNYCFVREFRVGADVNKLLDFLYYEAQEEGLKIDDEEFNKVIDKYTKKLRLQEVC